MKQLIWKELRENLKWALLGLLFVYFSLTYVVNDGLYFEEFRVLRFYSVMGAFTGFALGFAQIVKESAPDRWAFLMHRSLSARQVLLGKMVVGITLFLFVWLAATVIEICYLIEMQKLLYPMFWFRPIPALVAVMTGIPAYLAGLMFLVWKPRWKTTRLFLLGFLGLYAYQKADLMFKFGWDFLWVSLLIDLLLSVWLYKTALNFYRVSGEQAQAIRLSRTATLGGVSLGVFVVIGVCQLLVLLTTDFNTKNTRYAELVIGKQGDIYRVVKKYDLGIFKYIIGTMDNLSHPENKPFREQIARKELTEDKLKNDDFFASKRLGKNQTYASLGSGVYRYGEDIFFMLNEFPGRHIASKSDGLIYTYQTPQFRNRYVVTRYCGKSGFATPLEPKPERFGKIVDLDQVDSKVYLGTEKAEYIVRHNKFLLVCSDAIYKIVPVKGTVEKVYSAPAGNPIVDVGHFLDEKAPVYVIEHADSFRIMSTTIENINENMRDAGPVTNLAKLYLPDKQIGLIAKTGDLEKMTMGSRRDELIFYLPEKKAMAFKRTIADVETRVVEATFDGEIIFNQVFDHKAVRLGDLDRSIPLYAKLTAAGVPPLVAVSMGLSYLATTEGAPKYMMRVVSSEVIVVLFYFIVWGITIILGQWYCKTHQLTAQQKGRCFWATLLFGPAGLIAFWMIEEPPFLEPCAKCGKRMSVHADVCPACGTARGPLPEKERNIIAEKLTLPQADSIGARTAAEIVPS